MHSALSADRIGGAIWVLFGAAVVYGSWTMDRLESLQIPPLTAPGLLPGLLGLGFLLFGAILLLRPGEAAVPAATELRSLHAHASNQPSEWRRLLLSWALCVIYAGLLLGRGLPYWLLTLVFLFAHLMLLDESETVPAVPTRHRVLTAAILAPLVAIVVALAFQHIFLVRLP